MKESSRQNLWLAAWVVGFAVAMSCLLLVFKHRATFDALQRDRLRVVASGIDGMVERSFTFGIAFDDIAALPALLDSQKSTDDLIVGIDVADAAGNIAYSTEPSRREHPVEDYLRAAIDSVKGERWSARAENRGAEGTVVRNAFGLPLGYVIVRYTFDRLDEANAQFARRLVPRGVLIALAGTLMLFAILEVLHARLERRIARVRGALQPAQGGRGPQGSLEEQAARARANAGEAEAGLIDARARLEDG